MRRGQRVIDQCTSWLNYIITASPELTGYSVHFHHERRAWEFRFYREDKSPWCLEYFEYEINMRTFERFKQTLGKLFR